MIEKEGPLKVNADRIYAVARRRDEPLERRFPNIYRDLSEVRTTTHDDFTGRGGGGHIVVVKIRDGRVQVQGLMFWVS